MPKRRDAQKREEIRYLCEAHTELEGIIAARKTRPENPVLDELLRAGLEQITQRTITANKELIQITTKPKKKAG